MRQAKPSPSPRALKYRQKLIALLDKSRTELQRVLTAKHRTDQWKGTLEFQGQIVLQIDGHLVPFPDKGVRKGRTQVTTFWSESVQQVVFELRNSLRKPPINYFVLNWNESESPTFDQVPMPQATDALDFFTQLMDQLTDTSGLFHSALFKNLSTLFLGLSISYPAKIEGAKKSRDLKLATRLQMVWLRLEEEEREKFMPRAVAVLAHYEIKARFDDFLGSLMEKSTRNNKLMNQLRKEMAHPSHDAIQTRALQVTGEFFRGFFAFYNFLKRRESSEWAGILAQILSGYQVEMIGKEPHEEIPVLLSVMRQMRRQKGEGDLFEEEEVEAWNNSTAVGIIVKRNTSSYVGQLRTPHLKAIETAL